MVLIVKIVSVIILIYGCVLVLKPKTLKRLVDAVKKEKRFQLVNGIKTVVAALLVLAAPSCGIPWIVFLVGGLGVLGGIIVFIMKDKIKERFFSWVEELPNKKIVVIGIAAAVIGALLSLAA
ncbi:MAG: hypothetical protein ABH862_00050 [Candidatus Omnitrophota bacterium]